MFSFFFWLYVDYLVWVSDCLSKEKYDCWGGFVWEIISKINLKKYFKLGYYPTSGMPWTQGVCIFFYLVYWHDIIMCYTMFEMIETSKQFKEDKH